MKKELAAVFLPFILLLASCSGNDQNSETTSEISSAADEESQNVTEEETSGSDQDGADHFYIHIDDKVLSVKTEENSSAKAFKELLSEGDLSIQMEDYGNFEKVGPLPGSLPQNDEEITTEPGDIILYQGDKITIYYDTNTWSFTRLGKVQDISKEELKEILGDGGVKAVFSLEKDKMPKDMTGVFDLERGTVLLNSGYEMPIMGIGTYSLDHDTCINSVKEHLKNGGRLIDTAYMYHNEEAVGEAVRQAMEEYEIPREDIFVITKIYPSQFDEPEKAIEMALEKLDIGYVDMMLLHHPGDNDVEAYKAMEEYVKEGSIRSLGLSNYYVEELTDFLPKVNILPALVQNEIHPYYQEQDVVPFIQEQGIVVQGWYPLGGRGYTKELLNDETILDIAAKHNVSAAQVILRWDLQRSIVVIPGSENPDHIKENLDLLDFSLDDEDMERMASLDRNEKHDWY